MTFGLQFSLLWLLAWAALAFFTLSVCWLIISSLWQLSHAKSADLGKKSSLLPPGDADALNLPPKKSMAMEIGKMMILVGSLLLAYAAGVQSNYSKEYAAWKARSAEYQKLYAAWAARQPKEIKK